MLSLQEQQLLDYCLNGQAEEAEQLLKAGVSPNVQDNLGRSALMLACMQNQPARLVQLLLHYGTNLHIKDKDGKTALDYAMQNGCTETITILRQAHAFHSFHANNSENKTPMGNELKPGPRSNEVLEAILQVCDELKGLHPEVNPFIYFKKASVYLQLGKRHEARKLLQITHETFREAYGDVYQAKSWSSNVKTLYLNIIRLRALLEPEALYENLWLYNEAYYLAEEPELRFEMREQRDRLYRQLLESAFSLPEKKVVYITEELPPEEPELILPVLEDMKGILQFLYDAPKKGELYLMHPYRQYLLYPLSIGYSALLEDKLNELIRILQHLGAQSVDIYQEAIVASDPAQPQQTDEPGQIVVRYRFNPTQRPHIPSDTVWYAHEAEWQHIVKQRMQGAIFSTELICSLQQIPRLSKEEKEIIARELYQLQNSLSGITTRRKNRKNTDEKSTIQLQHIPEPSLQYRIKVEFAPIQDLQDDIRLEEIPIIDLKLLEQARQPNTNPDVIQNSIQAGTNLSQRRITPQLPETDTSNTSYLSSDEQSMHENKSEEPLLPPSIQRERPQHADVISHRGQHAPSQENSPSHQATTISEILQKLTQEERFYFEMLQHAYQDGDISSDIRKVLDRRRERLQIPYERAEELEKLVKSYYASQSKG